MPETITGHIVALGGGGFSMTNGYSAIDHFILSLAQRPRPRVCFIPTASAESPAYIAKFYRAFSNRCIPTDLTIFDPSDFPRQPARSSDLADFVRSQDVFYVGGGNTANLLAIWRRHGLDRQLRDAWVNGAVLAGISAGMICWFQGGLTDSFGGLEPLADGLGFLPGSACPHYDGESERRGQYHKLIKAGQMLDGFAADDGAALHFTGTSLTEVVSEKAAAGVYRVQRDGENVVETRLSPRSVSLD